MVAVSRHAFNALVRLRGQGVHSWQAFGSHLLWRHAIAVTTGQCLHNMIGKPEKQTLFLTSNMSWSCGGTRLPRPGSRVWSWLRVWLSASRMQPLPNQSSPYISLSHRREGSHSSIHTTFTHTNNHIWSQNVPFKALVWMNMTKWKGVINGLEQ